MSKPKYLLDDIPADYVSGDRIDETFQTSCIDLISANIGGKVVSYSDQWFAEASNLINPSKPIHIPGKVVYTGGWYDGWETRRHNQHAFDYVIIRLGVASGNVTGAEIDTAFFSGNEAPAISIEGCMSEDENEVIGWGRERGSWKTIIGYQTCGPSRRQGWKLKSPTSDTYNYVRLNMYPDGGIARFRLFGHAVPVFPQEKDTIFDLAAAVNGGVVVSCSDQHFGSVSNLLLPGRGKDMSDGWETKRSRIEGHIDWVIIRLGIRGGISQLVVDTAHYRGNFPREMQLQGIDWRFDGEPEYKNDGWIDLSSAQRCGPDQEHTVVCPVNDPLTHVKLIIIPDGGVKRVRAFGRRA